MSCTSGFVDDVMFARNRRGKGVARRILKVTRQGATLEAKSDIYSCIVCRLSSPRLNVVTFRCGFHFVKLTSLLSYNQIKSNLFVKLLYTEANSQKFSQH